MIPLRRVQDPTEHLENPVPPDDPGAREQIEEPWRAVFLRVPRKGHPVAPAPFGLVKGGVGAIA